MTSVLSAVLLILLTAAQGTGGSVATEAARLFQQGVTPAQFLQHVSAQRDRWLDNAAHASAPAALVDRLARVADGLRLLVVAEDWCPDSVNTVPYVVTLAREAQVPVAILNRETGDPVLRQHRTRDGRLATPTIILIETAATWGRGWNARPRSSSGSTRRHAIPERQELRGSPGVVRHRPGPHDARGDCHAGRADGAARPARAVVSPGPWPHGRLPARRWRRLGRGR